MLRLSLVPNISCLFSCLNNSSVIDTEPCRLTSQGSSSLAQLESRPQIGKLPQTLLVRSFLLPCHDSKAYHYFCKTIHSMTAFQQSPTLAMRRHRYVTPTHSSISGVTGTPSIPIAGVGYFHKTPSELQLMRQEQIAEQQERIFRARILMQRRSQRQEVDPEVSSKPRMMPTLEESLIHPLRREDDESAIGLSLDDDDDEDIAIMPQDYCNYPTTSPPLLVDCTVAPLTRRSIPETLLGRTYGTRAMEPAHPHSMPTSLTTTDGTSNGSMIFEMDL